MIYKRIVATAPIDQIGIDVLEKFCQLEIAKDTSEDTLLTYLEGTVGIVVRGEGTLRARVIERAKDLKVIGRPGVGYDSVDIKAATARGIPVVYAPGAGATAVAEGAIAMLLALVKKVSLWDKAVKSGDWNRRYEIKCKDLEGATLGIIGLGRIGNKVAMIAKAFDMKFLGYDPYTDSQKVTDIGIELVSLENLLRESDYITIHAPLTEETRGIINRKSLKLIKHGAILINTSRGKLIENLDVLLEALEDGRLSGVGLDVFPTEPPDVSHPIFKHPNCLTTPHSIGISFRSWYSICRSMAEDMVAVLNGEMPKFVVNPEVFSVK